MSERNWTPEQKRAIDERKRTLLVSAAAGSGKTATLTERIISSLINDDTADISRMIVVTFTRAAAAELRARISSALSDAIAKNPENKRLEKQLLLLPSAKINTIHGFCSDILRQNASALGLSPSFRVCEESERDLLLSDITKTLVEECFSSTDNPVCDGDEFCFLVDNLVSARSEGNIEEIFISMYEKLASFVDKVAALRTLRDNFLPFTEFFDTVAGGKIKENLKATLDHYRTLYEKNIDKVSAYSGAKVVERHLPAYEDDLSYIKRALSSLDKGYNEAKKAMLEQEKAKLGSVRGEDGDEYDEIAKATRTEFWKVRDGICKSFFGYTDEQLAVLQTRLYKFHSTLYLVLSELDRRFRLEKIRRGICDYGDLEHYALEILYDGEDISPVAKELRDYYDAIYIDEYQDINPIQHKIFSAIRREDNCFMVGDIKQSIYSFRLADPDIFAEMKKTFPKIDEAGETGEAAIFMSDNFRCDKTVVDFTNLVFDALFSVAGESIGYENKDRLIYSKQATEGYTPILPTVAIIEQASDGKAVTERLDALDEEDDESEGKRNAEAEYVAAEIKALLGQKLANGKKIKPSDIAILLRATSTHGKEYRDELRLLGIPVSMESEDGFFDDPEVLLALCLLNTVDNPQRDIWLMGLLHSPLYDFTLDELTLMRIEGGRELSLYDCLTMYVENHSEFEKGRRFLSDLERFRRMARSASADRVISYLYKETGILSMCGESSRCGHSRLLLLYNAAREFEASSFKGLYNFLCHINGLIEKGESLSEGSTAEGDGVRIMTIHKSKGLEFPVCFICENGRPLSSKDASGELVFDSKTGFSPKFLESDRGIRIENPVRRAIVDVIKTKSSEEELRVLYVAMTRARERLYITGRTRAKLDNFLQRCRLSGENMTEYSVLHTLYSLSWILSAMAKKGELGCELKYAFKKDGAFESVDIGSDFLAKENTHLESESTVMEEEAPTFVEETEKETEEVIDEKEIEEIKDILLKRFAFEYPDSHLSNMPAKLSVSKLYPEILNDEEELSVSELERAEEEEPTEKERERKAVLPRFLAGEEADSAMKGTATHLFMQFADFSRLKEKGAREELSRLVSLGFISESDAKIAFIDELDLFASSEFLSEILACKSVRREFRFNTYLDASLFTTDKEKKKKLSGKSLLVQGVIDCILEHGDGSYSIIDYKTDRLTPYELKNKWAAEKKLGDRHREQLKYYAYACEKMYGVPPKATKIYSLPLGRAIDVELK